MTTRLSISEDARRVKMKELHLKFSVMLGETWWDIVTTNKRQQARNKEETTKKTTEKQESTSNNQVKWNPSAIEQVAGARLRLWTEKLN